MNNSYHFMGYLERKCGALCKQILTRAYVFFALDVIIFIAHAMFLSLDFGLGGNPTNPSFMHTMAHMISLALIIACMFLQINLYNQISSCTDVSRLRLTFANMQDAYQAKNAPEMDRIAMETICQDLFNLQDATQKASRLLDIIEFFTAGAYCLLFLIPI